MLTPEVTHRCDGAVSLGSPCSFSKAAPSGPSRPTAILPNRPSSPCTRSSAGSKRPGLADYDGDGLVDLYLANAGDPSGESKARWLGDRTSSDGVLLKNLGGFHFKDVTREAGLSGEPVDCFGVVWLDLRRRGRPDLFLANHMGANVLWENVGGRFLKRPLPEGFGGFSMGATAGDLNGDGRGVLVADVTGDLQPDLIVRQSGGGPLRVYANRFPPARRLVVSLAGTKSNRLGIGATIEAEAGGRQVVRQIFPTNNFLVTQASQAEFGLGDAPSVDTLTVFWPSGETQVLHAVPTDLHIRITEGKAEYAVLGKR